MAEDVPRSAGPPLDLPMTTPGRVSPRTPARTPHLRAPSVVQGLITDGGA
jgi:hypothetical protein